MIEGKLEIFLSYKEPEYRDNLLWLRPYLNKEGYELLYYGSKGWVPLIDCCKNQSDDSFISDDEDISDIPIEEPILPPVTEDSDYNKCPSEDNTSVVREYTAPVPVRKVTYTPCNCKNKV